MFDLTGKTALVTGATGGIGGAIARALHAQGAKVAISGTRREVLDALAGELGGATVLPCDLADKDAVEALVPEAEEALGQLDILVANAGITKDNLFVAAQGRGLGAGSQRQSDIDLPARARGGERNDAAPVRPRDRHHVGGRRHRQSGAEQLHRRQGRHDRHVQVDRQGIRQARRHRELRGAGLHRDADDRQAQREAARGDPGDGSGGPARHRARMSRRRWSISRPTRRPMSPARRCTSTAEWR